MVRVLITEAHDGLGLALVKEYLAAADNQVVAFCGDKTKSDQLNTLKENAPDKQLLIVPVNLADEESIKASVKPIEGFVDALDLLIFNPGFISEEFFRDHVDTPKDILILSHRKIGESPKWLKNNLFPILEKGSSSKCIGLSPSIDRSKKWYDDLVVDKISPTISAISAYGKFVPDVDPNVVTVKCISSLSSDDILENDILDVMGKGEVVGQEATIKKAKALFEKIPNLSHGHHSYASCWHIEGYL